MPFSIPEKEELYDLFVRYYDSPDVYKIRDDQEFSMYGVQLPCFLLNEKRYLILLCPLDVFPVGKKRNIKTLRWVSLQARSLSDAGMASLPVHPYTIKRESVFAIPLRIHHRSEKISSYRTNNHKYPIDVSLLHVRGGEYEYPNEGNLVSALETFQTIVQWSI